MPFDGVLSVRHTSSKKIPTGFKPYFQKMHPNEVREMKSLTKIFGKNAPNVVKMGAFLKTGKK